MKLGFKSLGGSILASAVVVNLGAFGVSANDYIKVDTDFSTFSFGGVEFSSLEDLIEYLKKLISSLFVACKLNSGDKTFVERFKSAKNALDEAQKLKIRAKESKKRVLEKLERLREKSRNEYGNLAFDIDWKNREDFKAFEDKLWKEAESKGFSSITYNREQDFFNKIVMKSGVFNYVFRVRSFFSEIYRDNNYGRPLYCKVYSNFISLNLDDKGLELTFLTGDKKREFVSFFDESCEAKIDNLLKKISLLDYIYNWSLSIYDDPEYFRVFSDSENEGEFKFVAGSSLFTINDRKLTATVHRLGEESQEFDMTKLEDLEVLVGKMLECRYKMEGSIASLYNNDEQRFDYDLSENLR